MRPVPVLVPVLLAACAACIPPPPPAPDAGPAAGDGGPARDDGGATPPDAGDPCGALTPQTCAETPGCATLSAVPEPEHCAGVDAAAVAVACVSSATDPSAGCDDVITCATEPRTGRSFCFFDSCLPPGWIATPACVVPATCARGDARPPVTLCVRGAPVQDGERLEVGDRARFEVRPEGCFSSSCTLTFDAACAVVGEGDGAALLLDARLCYGDAPADAACTEDCGGGGTAACLSAPLAAGAWTATLGATVIAFDIPSTLPFGGACE